MPVYLCQDKRDARYWGVVSGENAADAIYNYDRHWIGDDKQDALIREEADDSINTYCQQLLTEYNVTELHRHDVLEWVERRLDGDTSISIIL